MLCLQFLIQSMQPPCKFIFVAKKIRHRGNVTGSGLEGNLTKV